ncbi:glycosyltransferase [Rhodococcus sp. SGAir0479]|uniref:glycosyltransferase n=1 Tax=Rhodococcus sp. SGAir0479 TaxID=2567884 RepID=UPI0010CD6610|nr:glycosyltransferase [Rhodococcus sp. SGAir0479]QCQ91353.1 glycosyltransferase [Rhodococcus sp. SGAir0479]
MSARGDARNILVWHVHGSWLDAFVRGGHRYLVPTLPGHGPWGRGRMGRDWPAEVVEVGPRELEDADVDVVVAQNPGEIPLATRWLGRTPGRDVPLVYVEHNTPGGHAPTSRHPMADRDDLTLVHVTHFNRVMWDTGRTRTRVVAHGVVDPGARYRGRLPRSATMINDPVRRWRAVGTDLLPLLASAAPIDVFGMRTGELAHRTDIPPLVTPCGDLPRDRLHDAVAERRLYLHTARWTSLGLSLVEAMLLAMPIVALASTEVAVSVPPEAGAVATDPARMVAAARDYMDDPEAAAEAGRRARTYALAHFALDRFLRDWDDVLDETARQPLLSRR